MKMHAKDLTWTYRIRGEHQIFPVRINSDDKKKKTKIMLTFLCLDNCLLPAVLSLGEDKEYGSLTIK